jgi:hypothetical protein
MENKKIRIYIDMDRTLCNYDKGMQLRKDSAEFPQSKERFWYELEPLEGAIEAFKYLSSKYEVWILTRPSFHNLLCYSEKAEWVRDNLGFAAQQNLILCRDKSLVKGDILIDDHYKDGQPEFEGLWIQIGNKEYPTWKEVLAKIDESFPV